MKSHSTDFYYHHADVRCGALLVAEGLESKLIPADEGELYMRIQESDFMVDDV